MYTTVDIKNQWQTVFVCGNTEDPKDVILILGSCRVVPYLNYLDHANKVLGYPFTIYCIDPINYQVDAQGHALDQKALLKALESDNHFLSILRSVTIFIHEYLESFRILNTKGSAETNIYQFGMKPRIDVLCPNLHDVFILFNDFLNIDPQFKNSPPTPTGEQWIFDEGEKHIDRFVSICEKSSFPEFGSFFRENYLKTRFFHSFNHVSSAFTIELFRRINEKFLHLELNDAYWAHIGATDLYGNVSTPLTKLDVKWRPYSWPEPIVGL